jgi:hypothetical protein
MAMTASEQSSSSERSRSTDARPSPRPQPKASEQLATAVDAIDGAVEHVEAELRNRRS